ncbi:MAG: hypothetical protein ACR2HX_09835 [Pyrinomonadaceae bacterium]
MTSNNLRDRASSYRYDRNRPFGVLKCDRLQFVEGYADPTNDKLKCVGHISTGGCGKICGQLAIKHTKFWNH